MMMLGAVYSNVGGAYEEIQKNSGTSEYNEIIYQYYCWGIEAMAAAIKKLEREKNDKIQLEAGKKADILILNLNDGTMTPKLSCISNIVYSANCSAVDTVIVNGRTVLTDDHFTTVDEAAVYADANKTLSRLVNAGGFQFRPCTWPIVE